jgi:hypothetical protein
VSLALFFALSNDNGGWQREMEMLAPGQQNGE